MFERFDGRARAAVMVAQMAARELGHTWIGTEHLLPGLVADHDGVAARVLASFDLGPDAVHAEIVAMVGRSDVPPPSHLPFTPRMRRVLDLSAREAQRLGHRHVGSGHLLLGLVAEVDGVAAQALARLGAEPAAVAEATIALLQASGGAPETAGPADDRRPFGVLGQAPAGPPSGSVAWAAGEAGPGEAIGAGPRCPHCRAPLVDDLAAVSAEAGGHAVVIVACGTCSTSLGVLPGEGCTDGGRWAWFTGAVASVHQCPHCDLRFASRTELEDHLRADHPDEVDDDTRSLDR